ncbi:MAG: quinone oxidoreductase family protein [Rhabdaerophilum sp.]
MVQVVQVTRHGGPEVLALADIALAEPGAGEVQIEQKAIGLNFIDTYFRTGLYAAPSMPFIPGNEGAGIVKAIGPDVKGLKPGDRVVYTTALGGYAASRNVKAAALVKLPKKVNFEEAASVFLKGLTAEYLLFRTFKVKPGHVVLVHAAAGGTGLILCQWAKSLGATVIGTAGSADKLKLAKKAGCDHVINYSTEDFAQRVSEITKGKKCDVVYDGVGKSTFAGSLDSLKPFGTLVSFGNASGPVDSVNLGILAAKGSLYVTRPTLMTHIADAKTYQAMAKRLLGAIAKGTIKVSKPMRFPLTNAADAHVALEGRQTTGSTILVP